jgi:hypothetical protein
VHRGQIVPKHEVLKVHSLVGGVEEEEADLWCRAVGCGGGVEWMGEVYLCISGLITFADEKKPILPPSSLFDTYTHIYIHPHSHYTYLVPLRPLPLPRQRPPLSVVILTAAFTPRDEKGPARRPRCFGRLARPLLLVVLLLLLVVVVHVCYT